MSFARPGAKVMPLVSPSACMRHAVVARAMAEAKCVDVGSAPKLVDGYSPKDGAT
jgi:hypothetical protein